MKKSLLLLSSAVMSLAISAQASPLAAYPTNSVSTADVASDQRIIGVYTSDDASGGFGLPKKGTYSIGAKWGPEVIAKADGGKLIKIRFYLTEKAPVNRVFVATVDPTTQIPANFTYQTVTDETKAGWNEVALSTPYEFVNDGSTIYCAGYEYVQEKEVTDGPVGLNNAYVGQVSYLFVDNNWDFMEGMPALAIQGIVEGGQVEKTHIALNYFAPKPYDKADGEINCQITMQNLGEEIPQKYTLQFAIDGTQCATADNPVELKNYETTGTATFALPAGLAIGQHTITAKIASVNGEAPKISYEKTARFNIYNNELPRQKFLIEQATSTSCTHCVHGEELLKKVANECEVAWVAMHDQQEPADPFYIPMIHDWMEMVNCAGTPTATFNRLIINGMLINGTNYQGEGADKAALRFVEDMKFKSAPAFASVSINTTLDNKDLKINVSGKAVDDLKILFGEDAVLTVYLTEDGLEYKQLSDGKWIHGYIHNHVLRQFVTPVMGEKISWKADGLSYENEFNVTLAEDWNAKNMHVIAFITRKIDTEAEEIPQMDVTNAEIAPVALDPSGIDDIIDDNANEDQVRYNITGQRVDSNYRGFVISKGKKAYIR